MKTLVYIDCRARNDVIKKLKQLGFEVVLITQNPCFDNAISAHPDMNIFFFDKKVFSSTNVRLCLKNHIVSINKEQGTRLDYPYDAFLNCVALSNDLICNKKSVAPEILSYATSRGFNVINVRQGYTKCNIAVVSEKHKAIITEDVGIFKTLSKAGYDVLLLKTHSVKLHPYDYGFIGGSCGLHNGILYFNGNIFSHPEINSITDFCKKYNVEIYALSEDGLEDCGSIYFVKREER